VTGSRVFSDTERLDLIERTQSYPWPDLGGVWKFRIGTVRFHAPTLRGVLDIALAHEPAARKLPEDE